jgi:hypothetical protein
MALANRKSLNVSQLSDHWEMVVNEGNASSVAYHKSHTHNSDLILITQISESFETWHTELLLVADYLNTAGKRSGLDSPNTMGYYHCFNSYRN